MARKTWACVVAVGFGLVACGGATIDPGDGGGGDSGQQDAAPDTWGPYACGSSTCGASEICIHPCCGGAPPPCEPPLDDAGTCPPGTHMGQCNYPNPGQQGCVMDPCTPPPPYCAPVSDPQYQYCAPMNSPRDCYEMCA